MCTLERAICEGAALVERADCLAILSSQLSARANWAGLSCLPNPQCSYHILSVLNVPGCMPGTLSTLSPILKISPVQHKHFCVSPEMEN